MQRLLLQGVKEGGWSVRVLRGALPTVNLHTFSLWKLRALNLL